MKILPSAKSRGDAKCIGRLRGLKPSAGLSYLPVSLKNPKN